MPSPSCSNMTEVQDGLVITGSSSAIIPWRQSNKASFIGTEKQLAKLETDAETTFGKIKAGNYEPTPGRHCKFCDFKEICEFRAA